ncbi:hypothetical protein BDW_11535 [Bdellovibrio bacteriovorus W]|nr:hypothetical protein BDW_11535 [Bdellovibrio bacteriovorus W]
MRQLNFTKVLLIGLLSCGLMACEAEQTEKDIVAEAQFCLNKAHEPAAVDSCVAPLAGLTSFYAYELKCAAGFVKADVTSAENLSKALTAINDPNAPPTLMLAALSFPARDSRGKDIYIDEVFSDCNNSGRPGLKLIGAMAKSATILSSLAILPSCTNPDPLFCTGEQIASNISQLITDLDSPTPETKKAANDNLTGIVESIQTVYQTTCAGAFNANSDICKQINTAAGAHDFMTQKPEEIINLGLELLKQWQ